jgi:AP2 domain
MKTIPLFGRAAAGRVALIDDEDYDLIAAYRWTLWERETRGRTNGPYAWCRMRRGGKEIRPFMHKLITGWPRTDHIDHDGLNNQRSNLRPATPAQNIWNQRPQLNHSSRYKGVTWHRGVRKWQAMIRPGGRSIYLGVFDSEVEAALAYDMAAIEEYGDFACLNGVTR